MKFHGRKVKMDQVLTTNDLTSSLVKNSPEVLRRIKEKEHYALFEKVNDGKWLLICETKKALEVLIERQKHKDKEIVLISG